MSFVFRFCVQRKTGRIRAKQRKKHHGQSSYEDDNELVQTTFTSDDGSQVSIDHEILTAASKYFAVFLRTNYLEGKKIAFEEKVVGKKIKAIVDFIRTDFIESTVEN